MTDDTPENLYSENAQLYNSVTGFTVGIYFPPDAPRERVNEFLDRVSLLAHEGFFPNREGWDPFIVGHAGDVLHVDSDEHVYLSTSCFHGDHGYCQGKDGICGPKTPARCKFCSANCTCICHRQMHNDEHGDSSNV